MGSRDEPMPPELFGLLDGSERGTDNFAGMTRTVREIRALPEAEPDRCNPYRGGTES